MNAPDKIWVWIEQLHGYECLSASGQPRADWFPTVEYTRTDLIPTIPSADYVAGLFEIAPSIGAPTADPTLRQVLEAYYKPSFGDDKIKELTQKYIDALAARPASPDTPPKREFVTCAGCNGMGQRRNGKTCDECKGEGLNDISPGSVASPDTRVVTVVQLEDWFDSIEFRSWTDPALAEIRAIIGGQDRG